VSLALGHAASALDDVPWNSVLATGGVQGSKLVRDIFTYVGILITVSS
jgi:hypothetical protein